MAANPISATGIKSHWRQQTSPSCSNNGLCIGVFIKIKLFQKPPIYYLGTPERLKHYSIHVHALSHTLTSLLGTFPNEQERRGENNY